jgi:hypothetical protein
MRKDKESASVIAFAIEIIFFACLIPVGLSLIFAPAQNNCGIYSNGSCQCSNWSPANGQCDVGSWSAGTKAIWGVAAIIFAVIGMYALYKKHAGGA